MGVVAIESARYDTPGKRDFRALLLALARESDCASYGTLWGGGTDARLLAEAGLRVIAAEVRRSLHDALIADAEANGYEAFTRRAGRLRQHVDMFHADFCGNASPSNFRELRHIAAITDRWLAVTLSPDHQLDASMQGESALFTVPAWLTGASGFTLEYFARYRRPSGVAMYVALLSRRDGRGTRFQVLPVQIARSVASRGYWASRRFYRSGLLRHSQPLSSERTVARQAEYYQEHRDLYKMRAKTSGQRRRTDPEKYARDLDRARRWRASEHGREWAKEYARARRQDPIIRERVRAYQREWYIRRKTREAAAADRAA